VQLAVVDTQQIASLCIQVERAIRKVKDYNILMAASLASSANQKQCVHVDT